MEIKLQIIHRSEFAVVQETYVMPIETYDYYQNPENVLHAKICEMRDRVEKEIPLAEQQLKELKEKA